MRFMDEEYGIGDRVKYPGSNVVGTVLKTNERSLLVAWPVKHAPGIWRSWTTWDDVESVCDAEDVVPHDQPPAPPWHGTW